MYCGRCGFPLNDSDRFCRNCGLEVPPDSSAQAGQTGSAQTSGSASAPAQKNERVDHPLPLILGIAGLVLALAGAVAGIVALPFACLGLPASVTAWILSYALVKKGQTAGTKMRVGRRLGIAGTILSVLFLALLVCLLLLSGYST
ncbi:MAG: hypothetical protein ILO68_04575 [Clostridia bacterium]|nr:hypothetical protein [Clostridia bacterium]